jgi:outer membrane lipoprotein-sorting protein
MNSNHSPDFEYRLRTLPADDAPRPEHRDRLREQALAKFDRALQNRSEPTPRWKILIWGKEIMKRPVSRYVAAASVLAALAWFLAPGSSAAAAYSKLVKAVVSAKSARFQAEITVEGQVKQDAQVAFLAPARYRMTFGNMVSISDFENAKMLTLMPAQKRAVIFNLKNVANDPSTRDVFGHFERLRQLLRDARDSAYEQLGEETIDGRKAIGFRLDTPISTLTMWGDPKTGDPIRIESVYSGVPRTVVVFSRFEMNPKLDAEQFAATVPAGYQAQSFDIDASKPQESDFVESLRICAELSGGEFPPSLDTQGLIKLMTGAILKDKPNGENSPETEKLMKQALQIGRGFQFALSLPAGAEARYAGKDVRKGAPNRPIFWYRPAGAVNWRVVDAALTVSDADAAPEIEGAAPIGKK